MPARARRLQAAAGAERRRLFAGAHSRPGPGERERAVRWLALGFHGAGKGGNVLRIYQTILDAVEMLQPVLRRIELKDRDLGRQLRRASCSIALNVAEGMYSRGANRQVRYHTALGSARETLACLELAQRCCTIAAPAALVARLDRIIGTLVKLAAA